MEEKHAICDNALASMVHVDIKFLSSALIGNGGVRWRKVGGLIDEQNHLPVSELFVGEFVFWVPRMNVHSYMDCDPRYVAGDNCACKLF